MTDHLLRSYIEPMEITTTSGGLWEPSGLEERGLSRRGILLGGLATTVGVGLVGCGFVTLVGHEALAASTVAMEIFKKALVEFIATFLTKIAAGAIEQARVFLAKDANSNQFHYSFSPFGVDKRIPCTPSKYGISVEVNLRARADHTRTIPVIKDLNTRELRRTTYEVQNTKAIVTPCGSRTAYDSSDKAAFNTLCKTKYKTYPSRFNLEYCRLAHVKASPSDEGRLVTSYGVTYQDDPTSGDLLVGVA